MRKVRFGPGEHYHLYNRGNNKRNIFMSERDYVRFLFLILFFQSPLTVRNVGRNIAYFLKHSKFNVTQKLIDEICKKRTVSLLNFVLMPNHFHITVREEHENGVSDYMQRVECGYTMYYNLRYKSSGHLLQGPFRAVHISNNVQLLHLSAYIHKNPRELKRWRDKEHLYPWSSYKDYIGENRWGALLNNDIVVDQFDGKNTYYSFVKTSVAKENLPVLTLLDPNDGLPDKRLGL